MVDYIPLHTCSEEETGMKEVPNCTKRLFTAVIVYLFHSLPP
jgi:hypothetical protein